ncbi:hypothetical protein M427DRAFT_53030 [Gonapodya prolifera JEL478]|uniref:Uncharacterized protein n=1 Tax=Gonapodya prolifera (strain JEL478) TaxID=1344416 RepID=A0A139ASJ3_GONPJ|nr:hypothetical protein M427DRAFT_53030 [Gonapodya prolifera JEL478]|eukprot:KXS19624.1 hypothetical protein M427DRAFT_53030 [Gonapodya prolifera JEL478]
MSSDAGPDAALLNREGSTLSALLNLLRSESGGNLRLGVHNTELSPFSNHAAAPGVSLQPDKSPLASCARGLWYATVAVSSALASVDGRPRVLRSIIILVVGCAAVCASVWAAGVVPLKAAAWTVGVLTGRKGWGEAADAAVKWVTSVLPDAPLFLVRYLYLSHLDDLFFAGLPPASPVTRDPDERTPIYSHPSTLRTVPTSRAPLRQLLSYLRRQVRRLLLHFSLLVLSQIPLVGTFVYPVALALFTHNTAGFDWGVAMTAGIVVAGALGGQALTKMFVSLDAAATMARELVEPYLSRLPRNPNPPPPYLQPTRPALLLFYALPFSLLARSGIVAGALAVAVAQGGVGSVMLDRQGGQREDGEDVGASVRGEEWIELVAAAVRRRVGETSLGSNQPGTGTAQERVASTAFGEPVPTTEIPSAADQLRRPSSGDSSTGSGTSAPPSVPLTAPPAGIPPSPPPSPPPTPPEIPVSTTNTQPQPTAARPSTPSSSLDAEPWELVSSTTPGASPGRPWDTQVKRSGADNEGNSLIVETSTKQDLISTCGETGVVPNASTDENKDDDDDDGDDEEPNLGTLSTVLVPRELVDEVAEAGW